MSSPSSPYTQDQVNAQSPASGGNANIFVVSPRPSRLPNRVSHLTMCLPCLLPSSSNGLALLPKNKNKKQTKNSPPFLLPLSLPTFPSPHSPLPQWSPKGNPALPLSYFTPPDLPSLPITRKKAGIMKEIRDDLEGGFGFGQGHVGMSCCYYYTLGRVGVGGREGCFRL